jgi:hypothetical protein
MKTHAFIYQSELTSPINKLIAHFPKYNFQNKIDIHDIKYFEDFIGDADILVISELHFLKEFMSLHKDIEMIYLDLFSVESCVLKIYKIWQTVNNDSAIVVAENEEEARRISPLVNNNLCFEWVEREEDVNAEYLGEAKDGSTKGVLLSSFSAG